jgi:ubiquinone/menaquinone biosynthesis C-methylase UbiE
MNIIDSIVTLLSYVRQPSKRSLIKEAYKLRNKTGLEIGGPTAFFGIRGGFPVYLFAKKIDGVNFSNETIWEGQIKQGDNYRYYKNKIGYQYIAEATDLQNIPGDTYDFILSSHSLEHVANPIKALKEWNRLLKKNGTLILILPDKRYTFDNKRNYTTIDHLLADYTNGTSEHDTTHFEEILQTHDEEITKVSYDECKSTLHDNFVQRCAHHHVFSLELIKQILAYSGYKIQTQTTVPPFHMLTVAVK